ncbi:MAG: hypothetical protein EOM68_29905 [Spirochaetia bacterium]|nr:hypothetical protein [Spirochaetia bacterium]
MNMSDIETYRQMYMTPDPEMRRAVRKAFCYRFRTEPFLDQGWDAVSLSRLGEDLSIDTSGHMKPVVAILAEGGTMKFPSIEEAARFYEVNVNTMRKWIKLGRPCKGCHDRLFLKEVTHEEL